MTGTPDSNPNGLTPPRHVSRRGAFWFAATLALVQILALAVTFWLTSRPWFMTHDGYPMLASMGYTFRAAGQDCAILLAGDSTALAGLNPAVFERRTGMKSCNIGEVRSVSDFFGTHFIIDQYLKHNKPPRFIVMGFSATSLNLEHKDWLDSGPEDLAYAMQYRRDAWLWTGMITHPHATFVFLTWAETRILDDSIQRLRRIHARNWTDERTIRDSAQGQWIAPYPVQTACVGHDTYHASTRAENQASVAAFRSHYTTDQTTVLMFVTPVADCNSDLSNLHRLSDGVADNELQAQPVGDFNWTDTHLTHQAADRFSESIADRVVAMMTAQTKGQRSAGQNQP